jgi:hypothetical protein
MLNRRSLSPTNKDGRCKVDRRRLNKEAESEPVESSCVVLAYMQSEIITKSIKNMINLVKEQS